MLRLLVPASMLAHKNERDHSRGAVYVLFGTTLNSWVSTVSNGDPLLMLANTPNHPLSVDNDVRREGVSKEINSPCDPK